MPNGTTHRAAPAEVVEDATTAEDQHPGHHRARQTAEGQCRDCEALTNRDRQGRYYHLCRACKYPTEGHPRQWPPGHPRAAENTKTPTEVAAAETPYAAYDTAETLAARLPAPAEVSAMPDTVRKTLAAMPKSRRPRTTLTDLGQEQATQIAKTAEHRLQATTETT